MDDLVSLRDIEAARARMGELVRLTPVLPSTTLSTLVGAPVVLKCEHLQRSGSFKLRGATNMLAQLDPRPAGVIAASAGNHAQGVAVAAGRLDLPATVVMPHDAPIAKQEATRGYGAEVVLVDGPLSEAIRHAADLADERGLRFVPPFDAPEIVAGQGTLGLELLDQEPDLKTVLVPAGGGGLLAGVACAVKSTAPHVRVVGVQAQAMAGIVESLAAGTRHTVPAAQTLADGAAVSGPSELTLGLISRYADDVVAVSEEAIARAIVLLIERTKQVIEGAGALGVAALLEGVARPAGRTAVVLSGGNIDINLLDRIVERGLLNEGRRQRLTVAASNSPGELSRITRAIADAGGNVIEVGHELVTADLPVGVARLSFRLEVAGPEAFEDLKRQLLDTGLRPGTVTDFITARADAMPE